MIETEAVRCDICEEDQTHLLFIGKDYRFGRQQEYRFVQCKNCGFIYLNPRPTQSSIVQLYEEDYTPDEHEATIVPEQGMPRWKTLKKLWHRLNGKYYDAVIACAHGRVLDVGCGDGKYFLPLKHMHREVYGVESNRRYAKIHKQLGFSVFYGNLEDAHFPDEFFDTVILSQVIEHLPSPRQSLKEIKRILRPAGKVIIYCPNANGYLRSAFGKYWHGWHIPFHFYVFSSLTLSRLAQEVGLTVRRIKGVTPSDFFTTSLKSYCFGDKEGVRSIDRGRFFDTVIFRASIAPILRLLDMILRGKQDCLAVELTKL